MFCRGEYHEPRPNRIDTPAIFIYLSVHDWNDGAQGKIFDGIVLMWGIGLIEMCGIESMVLKNEDRVVDVE